MATYYWVGGNGNWDASTTTNWATSSGGAGSAGVPTASDSVIFDANSNTGTSAFAVTVTGTSASPAVCLNFTTGGAGGALYGAMTLTMGATAVLTCYGSMTLPAANLSVSATAGSIVNFATTGSDTLTSNGVSFNAATVTIIGTGTLTLGSAFSSSSTLSVNSGTFTTSNFNITAVNISITGSSTRTINMGSSSATFSGANPLIFSASNLTFNAGTSTITCSNATPTFAGGSNTFYNVTFSSTAIALIQITGNNTFNDLTCTARAAAGIGSLFFDGAGTNTVNGTLTLGSGTTGVARLFVRSATLGSASTLSVATLAAITDIDFRDITASGVSSPWSGTRIGNCLGNTNISYAASRTVYWNSTASANWNAAVWSTTSGNAGGTTTAFPLAQDTIVIDNAGLGTGNTITLPIAYNIGTLDFSTRSNAATFATGTSNPVFYGDLTYSSALTVTGTLTLYFAKQSGVATITSAGIAFTQSITQQAPNGTVRINGDLTLTSAALYTLTQGTLDLTNNGAGNYNLTSVLFSSSGTATRSITFGTAGIYVTGSNQTIFNIDAATSFTYTGSGNFYFTYSGSTGTRSIYFGATGASQTNVPNIYVNAGSDTVSLQGGRNYKTVDFTGFTGTLTNVAITLYGSLVLSTGMTVGSGTGTVTFVGSLSNQITTNGQTLDFPITFGGTGGTWQLQDAMTVGSTRTVTLNNGTLDLNGKTLTTGLFSATNSNTRTLAFGTGGRLVLTGTNATIYNTQNVANMSYSGDLNIDVTANASTGTRTIAYNATGFTWTAAQIQANAANFRVMAGTDTVLFSARCGSVDFTGFSGTLGNGNLFSYGSIKFSPTMVGITPSTNSPSIGLFAETGSWTLQTAGLTFDRLFGFGTSATGTATYTLVDDLTVIAGTSTGTVTLTCGTLNMNNNNLTCDIFGSSNSYTRTLAFGTGTIAVTGSGATAWNAATSTNLTTTGTGKISMTSATAKTFVGGGAAYAATLDQGGAGALTITGSNTFRNITASIASTSAASILFTSGTTTTLLTGFDVDGTAANAITVSSATAAAHTLSLASGTVVANYLNLSYSTATGGAAWYLASNSTNGGNLTGWQSIQGTAVVSIGQGITIQRGVVFS